MPINLKRKAGVKKKSDGELLAIVKSGTLSAAAAYYELNERGYYTKARKETFFQNEEKSSANSPKE